jgi:ribonuclease HI
VTIYTDSSNVVGAGTGQVNGVAWDMVENLDLINQIRALTATKDATFKWVKGHRDEGNIRADFLAGQMAAKCARRMLSEGVRGREDFGRAAF